MLGDTGSPKASVTSRRAAPDPRRRELRGVSRTGHGARRLQLGEFKGYVTTLSAAFGRTFHGFAEIFVLGVVFRGGNDGTEEVDAALTDTDITAARREDGALARVMDDERMRCLFHMFDLDSDGVVDYIEVVNGIYKITEDLDEAKMAAMIGIMMSDEEGDAALDYEEFTRFVLRSGLGAILR